MCIECWWNGNWQGKIEVATEKICLNVTLCTTSPAGMTLTDETEPELPQWMPEMCQDVSQPHTKVDLYVALHICYTISFSKCWKSEVMSLSATLVCWQEQTIQFSLYVLIQKRCLWREMWIVYWKQNGFTKGTQFAGISNKIQEERPLHCHTVCSSVMIHIQGPPKKKYTHFNERKLYVV